LSTGLDKSEPGCLNGVLAFPIGGLKIKENEKISGIEIKSN
jgi:hypothetical protein